MRLLGVCAAALAGIALADLRPIASMPLLCAAMVAGLALVCVRQSAWRTLALMVLAAAFGAARVVVLPPAPVLAVQDGSAGLRAQANAGILANLPEPQASLVAGVLLGGTGRLDGSFRDDLQRSGLSHVLAIDGFKEVVLAGSVGWLTARCFSGRVGVSIAVVTVAGYTLLTGAHPSAVRAALMLGLASLATLSGRLPDPLLSLAVAILIMACLDPRVLLDVGLQLSLSATLGLILLWPSLRRTRAVHRLPRWLSEPIGLSATVTLACLPVTLATFEQVSLISPLAHVVAVPVLPGVLLGAALLSLVAPLPAPLPALAAWLVWAPAAVLTVVVRLSGELPGAAITTGRLPLGGSLALAAVLLGYGISQLPELADVRAGVRRWLVVHGSLLVPVSAGATCAFVAGGLQLARPDGHTHIDQLSVAPGQAVLIRGPTGERTLVVQGRPAGRVLAAEVGAHLPVWEHTLDEVVAVDATAARALALTLKRYPTNRLVEPT
jgi:competence protein ComEC